MKDSWRVGPTMRRPLQNREEPSQRAALLLLLVFCVSAAVGAIPFETVFAQSDATEGDPATDSSSDAPSSIEDRLTRQRASADTPGARLLAEVSIPFFSVSRFRAEFVQTQEWVGMDDPAFYRGTLFLDRPNKFRIEYAEPAGHLQVCDGKRVYTYVPENEQVLVTYLPEDGRADILGRILEESRPQPEILNDELEGSPVRVLVLEPPLELELAEVRIWTRANSDAILQYELVELSGNRSTYRFLETWDDPEMDPSLFEFTAPPGVPLVEVG